MVLIYISTYLTTIFRSKFTLVKIIFASEKSKKRTNDRKIYGKGGCQLLGDVFALYYKLVFSTDLSKNEYLNKIAKCREMENVNKIFVNVRKNEITI